MREGRGIQLVLADINKREYTMGLVGRHGGVWGIATKAGFRGLEMTQ